MHKMFYLLPSIWIFTTGCLEDSQKKQSTEPAPSSENEAPAEGSLLPELPLVPETPVTEAPPIAPASTPVAPAPVLPETVPVLPETAPVVPEPIPESVPAVPFSSVLSDVFRVSCLRCHQGPRAAEGVDLSTQDKVLNGSAIFGDDKEGEATPLVVAGKPESSLLWKVIESERMPLGRSLTEEQKVLIKSWIETGANP